MANTGTAETKKLALLRILQILQRFSDYDHPLTQADIGNKLLELFGIDMERKAISRNVNLLREAGFDIPSEGRGIYLQGSESDAEMPGFDFEESELRLLIDSVLSSSHISGKEADVLVAKLSKMGNSYFAQSAQSIKSMYSVARVDTADMFYSLSVVCKAMSDNRKITISELRHTSDSKLHEWRGSERTISPYNVVAARGGYYLIGITDGEDCFKAYRLERLYRVTATNEPREMLTLKMRGELAEFTSTHPLMVGGAAKRSTMLVNKMLLGDVVDAFGGNFTILKKLKDEYYVEVKAPEEELVDWAMRYAEKVEILTPDAVREKIYEKTQLMSKRYTKWNQPDRYQRLLSGLGLGRYTFININLEKETEFRKLPDIVNIHFEHNNLSDFSFLRNCADLRSLSIVKNPVERLPFGAANCKISLKSFELSETAVSDISFLDKMPDLQTLMLGRNPIEDYSPIYRLKNLKRLFLIQSVADKLDLKVIEKNNPGIRIKTSDEYPHIFMRFPGRIWRDGESVFNRREGTEAAGNK